MSAFSYRCLVALLLAAALCAINATSAVEPRLDLYHDPPPEEPLYRVGSMRFRIGRDVVFLTFLRDGKRLFSINRGPLCDVVRYWDAVSGKMIREFPLAGGSYGAAALSADGKLLAALRYSKGGEFIRIMDTATGQEIHTIIGQYAKGIAFSPDGRTLAAADEEGIIYFYDPVSGKKLDQWKGEKSRCHALAFSPDGKLIAGIDDKSMIRLWDRAAGCEIKRCAVKERSCHMARLAFSADGATIVASFGGTVLLWNIKTGRMLRSVPLPDKKWCCAVAISPNGKLAAAEDGDTVCLLDTTNGNVIRKWVRPDYPDSDGNGGGLAFSPDGKLLAWGLENIHLWRNADGKKVRPLGDDALEITAAAFTPDERFLATRGPDEIIRFWDAANGSESARRFKASGPTYAPLAFAQDGKTLFFQQNKQVLLWDWATGRELPPIEAPTEAEWTLALSPSTRMLAWRSKDRVFHLRDTTTGKELHSWRCRLEETPYPIHFLRFSPDGKFLIAVDPYRRQSEVRAATKGARHPSAWRDGMIIAITDDARIAALIDQRMRIHFQELASGEGITCTELADAQLFPGATPRRVHAAVFSPDGRTLATAIEHEPIRLWETSTGTERYRVARQRGRITQLAFAPDGSKLVGVSTEKNAAVWRIYGPPPGRQRTVLSAEQLQRLWAALASKDGRIAFRAIRVLTAAAPDPVVAFLRHQDEDVMRLRLHRIARWIAELDSDEFAVREKAMAKLEKVGDLAEDSMRRALQDHPTLEMRKRLEILLDKLKDKPVAPPAIVRGWRAVEVLEHLATPEARQLLKEWSKDIPEAKAALERLTQRSIRKP